MQRSKVSTLLTIIVIVVIIIISVSIVQQHSAIAQLISTAQYPFSLNTVFKQVENSVVQITSKTPTSNLLTNPQTQNTTALGSGFVYDKIGHIITNSHVINGAKIVDVTFVDGNRYTANVI
jgi:S1-C subfamily serine protease